MKARINKNKKNGKCHTDTSPKNELLLGKKKEKAEKEVINISSFTSEKKHKEQFLLGT